MNTPLSNHLAPWIDHFQAMVWRHVGAGMPWTPLLGLLYNRLRRLMCHFAAAESAWRSGTLRARAAAGRTRKPSAPPALRLPQNKSWLLKLLPLSTFYFGPVQALLENPETRALVAAAPRAGRSLRPLCRMLGMAQPAWLRLPPRPRKPRVAVARPPRLRQTPLHLTRRKIESMTAAELTYLYGKLPPHFPLPIPNLNLIRRKIAAG